MATKRFTFDGAADLDDGLSFKFARATATIVERHGRNQGQAAPNIPRFGGRKLLCGAPVVTTIAGTTTEAHDLMAVGVDADGVTPVYVVKKAASGTLTVYVGEISGAGYSYNIQVNASKDNQLDFLRESADNQATEAWSPKAALICHGLIIVACNVHHNNGTNWGHRRLGIATCRVADLAGAKSGWWRRHAVSDVLPGLNSISGSTNDVMVSSWAMQTYMVMDRTGDRPLKVWFGLVDYQSGSKLGGVFVILPATRPDSSSGDWTVDAAYELHRFSRTASSAHAHGVCLMRSGTLGIDAVCSRGDSSGNNCNYALRLSSEGSATGASTAYRTGATLPSNGSVTAVNYYSGASSWSAVEYIHGMIDDEGSGDITDDPTANRRLGFQTVPLIPGPTSRTLIGCLDEGNAGPVMIASVPASGGTIKWQTLYGLSHNQSVTGKASSASVKGHARNLALNARCASPEKLYGPMTIQLSPSEFAYTRDRNCRVLFAPDSQDFGQCWAHRVLEQNPVIFDPARKRVWAGDANNTAQGIRWIPEPSCVVQSPLEIANGAKNYLKTQASGDCTNRGGAAHTITFQPVLPSGAGAPPVLGNNVWKLAYTAASGAGDLCVWWLTDVWNGSHPIPLASKAVKVRLWVLLEPPETFPGSAPATGCNSAGASFRFRGRFNDNAGGYLTGYSNSITLFDNSSAGWTPITLEFDPATYKAWAQNYGMELFLEAQGGAKSPAAQTPLNIYVAFESVTVTDAPGYPVAPQVTGDHELATLAGFSAGGSFTMAAMGETPRGAAWDMASPDALYLTDCDPTNASGGSATQTKLTSGSATNGAYVGCRIYSHDQTILPTGDFGLLITAYDGTTKLATHAAHGGTRSAAVTASVLRPCTGFDASNPGLRPLWSGCNATATTGFTVFADSAGGKLSIAAWNGSAYGTLASIDNIHWLGGSPVLSVVTYDSVTQTLTLRASAGGVEIASASLSSVTFAAALTELRFASLNASPTVTPMAWYRGFVDDASALSSTAADAELVSVAASSGSSGSSSTWSRLPRLAT